ncbi:MAG: EamA family transporter [Methanophagales archaeon]|nr:EamA family transporter [Methanophagales archaeon]
MLWFIFAFLTALFEATKDVLSKKSLKDIDEYVVAWSLPCFALPFLLPILLFTAIPPLGERFWLALVTGGTLYAFTLVLYMKALKSSDLSITVPMLTFTPLFLLITSPLMVGEFPGIFGLIGIFLIVAGSYLLNINKKSQGYLAPFKALLKEKGPRLMLVVAFIWSITANIDKIGLQNSSPLFWVIAVDIYVVLLMLPLCTFRGNRKTAQIRANWHALLTLGLFGGLTAVCQMTAISLTLVAYVISIKRTSAIGGVLFGYLIFKEMGIRARLVGAIVMVFGVLFITLF